MGSGRERVSRDSGVARPMSALAEPGRALDGSTRARMEASFGTDFSNVRVHTSPTAAESARSMDAKAYAHGNDIAFAQGRYAPGTAEGEGLIAHELGHVVDQTQRGAPHEIMRQAGKDPVASWDALVTVDVTPQTPERLARATEAKRRLAMTPEGAILLNQLWSMFGKGHKHPTTKIVVHVGDSLPQTAPGDADGMFSPSQAGASAYDIWIKDEQPDTSGSTRLGGMWPSTSATLSYYSTHTDPESDMAATLFHELLHVWFVNNFANSNPPYPTGHGDVNKDQMDPAFFAPLKEFNAELDDLETKIHQEAALPAPPPPTPASQVDLKEPPTPRREPAGPSSIGGQVTAGGFAGKGAGGILGADLLLGRITALDVGVRGIYLTPNQLLAGGSVGMRFRQGSDELGGYVQRPLFFDLELGILHELSPSDTTRLSNAIAGMGSIGIGQELGRTGPRFMWRVGGFVLVGDKKDASGSVKAAGGATATVGLVF